MVETNTQRTRSIEAPTLQQQSAAASDIPQITFHFADLPNTRLHYIKCGVGPPMIMVPATVSNIDNWQALAQFLGQRFTVYFFELPGHGRSTPLPCAFSSSLAAETVEDFVDYLGCEQFSLMGFSFGGILTIAALQRLRHRIDKVVLVSPAITRRALTFTPIHLWTMKRLVRTIRNPWVRRRFLNLMRSETFGETLAGFVSRFGGIEKTISVKRVFRKISDSTVDVLSYQLGEMLDYEIFPGDDVFEQRCLFAMSVRDPLLDFDTTLEVAQQHFPNLHVERFNFPYHQPPATPTFEEINRDYARLLDNLWIE